MTRRQASIIIVLVTVLILVLAGVGAALVLRDPDDVATGTTGATAEATTPATTSETAEEELADPADVLEQAGFDVVLAPPAPEAPGQWGGYRLGRSWDGRVRVFEGSDPVALSGPDQGVFPASQNNCGSGTFYITFRAGGPDATLHAQLRNAVDTVLAEDELTSGWMLGTNCSVPYIGLAELPGEGNLTDIVYTVHEYRQSSVAPGPQEPQQQVAPPVSSPAPAPPTPPTQPAPTPVFVECHIFGLGPPQGLFSDGSIRDAPDCVNHPDFQRMVEAEGVCGGMYGWMEVTAERYLDLCGVPPPTHRVPPPSPQPGGYPGDGEQVPY